MKSDSTFLMAFAVVGSIGFGMGLQSVIATGKFPYPIGRETVLYKDTTRIARIECPAHAREVTTADGNLAGCEAGR